MNRRLKRAHSLYWFHCLHTCSLSDLDTNTFNVLATWLARCIDDLNNVAWQWIYYLVDQPLNFERQSINLKQLIAREYQVLFYYIRRGM